MDEFDKHMKHAKKQYLPQKDFVDMTMKKVKATHPRKLRGLKLWVPTAAGGALLVIGAILLTPLLLNSNGTTTTPTAATTKTSPSTSSQTSASPSVPAGTDNASLDSDLNGINSSMNQESSDQSSADSAVNDSSQEIAVPSS